jgi:hypothetical protein
VVGWRWWVEGATFTESRASETQAATLARQEISICAVEEPIPLTPIVPLSSVYTIDHSPLPLQPHCLSRSCVNKQSAGLDPADRLTHIHTSHYTTHSTNTTTTTSQHTSRTSAHHGLRGYVSPKTTMPSKQQQNICLHPISGRLQLR